MNKAVFTAAIIQRHGWKQDVSFVGHENTVEVTVSRLLSPSFLNGAIEELRFDALLRSGLQPKNLPSTWRKDQPSEDVVDGRSRIGRPQHLRLAEQPAGSSRRYQGGFRWSNLRSYLVNSALPSKPRLFYAPVDVLR
jgi:hypothetical protein